MHYYSSQDMARLYCAACNGCGDCCRGMGDTVLLDPRDVCFLSAGLNKSFDELLKEDCIRLCTQNGLILPHLAMKGPDESCAFLQNGSCSIHSFRPGLCRLFPLGRQYTDAGISYFIIENGCDMPGKVKVRIDKWLDIPSLGQYEEFLQLWHAFIKDAGSAVRQALDSDSDDGYAGKLSMFFLQVFFAAGYEPDSFYESFKVRLKKARELI